MLAGEFRYISTALAIPLEVLTGIKSTTDQNTDPSTTYTGSAIADYAKDLALLCKPDEAPLALRSLAINASNAYYLGLAFMRKILKEGNPQKISQAFATFWLIFKDFDTGSLSCFYSLLPSIKDKDTLALVIDACPQDLSCPPDVNMGRMPQTYTQYLLTERLFRERRQTNTQERRLHLEVGPTDISEVLSVRPFSVRLDYFSFLTSLESRKIEATWQAALVNMLEPLHTPIKVNNLIASYISPEHNLWITLNSNRVGVTEDGRRAAQILRTNLPPQDKINSLKNIASYFVYDRHKLEAYANDLASLCESDEVPLALQSLAIESTQAYHLGSFFMRRILIEGNPQKISQAFATYWLIFKSFDKLATTCFYSLLPCISDKEILGLVIDACPEDITCPPNVYTTYNPTVLSETYRQYLLREHVFTVRAQDERIYGRRFHLEVSTGDISQVLLARPLSVNVNYVSPLDFMVAAHIKEIWDTALNAMLLTLKAPKDIDYLIISYMSHEGQLWAALKQKELNETRAAAKLQAVRQAEAEAIAAFNDLDNLLQEELLPTLPSLTIKDMILIRKYVMDRPKASTT